jgi:hypothetical protein
MAFRLALVRSYIELIRAEMETQRRDLDAWADVAIDADNPIRGSITRAACEPSS